ncbi:MAG TPA: aldehyde dehydrogenase, partial [Clostridiales bacterium]|nr:aldehyde dehydrogenase [Clostridiales bacterium]
MIQKKIEKQKEFFKTNKTKDISFRMLYLFKLKEVIQNKEEKILEALKKDLGKSDFEAYTSEVGFVLKSLDYTLKNIRNWAKTKKVRRPIFMPISKSYVKYEPHGNVLIIGPFNYPFQLIMEPLIGALAAGNTAIIKPSDKTPETVEILKEIIEEVFDKEHVDVVTGNREAVSELIHSDFDYIFFTGSVPVGKIVMEAASKNLTPVTLELGGKSPAIVHKDADIEKAAARIAWGKYYNSGQTCIAPDYIYVHEDVKDRLLEGLIKEIVDFYGVEPLKSPDYGRIINHKEFNRLSDLIDDQKLYFGGEKIEEKLKISPTILTNVTWDDDVMQEEIFGPILPVLTYNKISEVVNIIKDKPRPLSLYLFTEDKNLQKKIEDEVPFGGGCINDTISHVSSPR